MIMKNVTTTISKLAVVIAVAILSITNVNATGKDNIKKENPVEVKFLGNLNEQPVFQIQFDNATEEEILFVMRDAEGTVIYSEKFSGKKFSKKFQFEKADLSDLNVQLELFSKKNNETQAYTISKSTRTVDEVVVSRLK
jgi:hypothetical protein